MYRSSSPFYPIINSIEDFEMAEICPESESKYGFYCDIEQPPIEQPTFYMIKRSHSYEIRRSFDSLPPPSNAVPHPVYSPETVPDWYIAMDVESGTIYNKMAKPSFFKILKRKMVGCLTSMGPKTSNGLTAKQYIYSSVVCSMFLVSVYIAIIMPIG